MDLVPLKRQLAKVMNAQLEAEENQAMMMECLQSLMDGDVVNMEGKASPRSHSRTASTGPVPQAFPPEMELSHGGIVQKNIYEIKVIPNILKNFQCKTDFC